MNNNARLAQDIMSHVGGAKNIASLNHCATRLRLTVKNEKDFNVEEIKKITGVLDVVKSMGGYQIVVGNNVSKVFNEITQAYNISEEAKGGRVAGNPIEKILNILSDVIGPIIPVIVVAGLLSALLTICTMTGLSTESTTYLYINAAAQAPFYFLPFLVAYTSAKHWNLSPILVLMLAGVLLYPDVIGLMESGGSSALFGLPVTAATYTSSLIPIILTTWLMSYVYKYVDKICPEALRYVFTPFITIVIMIPVMLCISGPVGSWLGTLLNYLVSWLDSTAPGLSVFVMGCLAPFMVLTGSHLALIPIVLANFATKGYDTGLMVAFIGMNFSQFAVSLAIFLKAKSATLKSTAFSTGLTAFLAGTTEPALYGLSVRLKKPLIATFMGSAAGGLYCAIFTVKEFSFGVPGFFGMVNFIDPAGSNNFYHALAAAAVTIIVTFIATWVLGFDESSFIESESEKTQLRNESENESIIVSPADGELRLLQNISDPVFSKGTMGSGIVILPSAGEIYAPVSGEIIVLPSTKHAIGIRSNNGIEVLIHIGLESQLIENEFSSKVKENQKVSKGELLLTFDKKALEKKGYSLDTVVVVTNSKEFKDIVVSKEEKASVGDNLIAVI